MVIPSSATTKLKMPKIEKKENKKRSTKIEPLSYVIWSVYDRDRTVIVNAYRLQVIAKRGQY